jgi:hypothetical protein
MRNLLTLRDTGNPVSGEIASVDHDNGSHELLVLHKDGKLFKYELSDCNYIGMPIQEWDISQTILEENGEGERDETWFDVSIIRSTGSIVCISNNGNLACIYVDLSTGLHSEEVTCEGEIDSGIVTAGWSPEQERVVIVTGNNSLLCMSHSWDVLEEVPIEARIPNSKCTLSWRGDGTQFVLQSVDVNDDINYIRVFSNELEIIATGRNIADGAASLLKGIGSAVAFAQNGTLIAFPQERIKGKYQIAFIEKNGLRHGDFDLHVPSVLPEGYSKWEVSALMYDSSTTLLAVTVIACKEDDENLMTARPSCVQLYYRGNYHWYLKQQYRGLNITCLGFDSEVSNRLYLADTLEGSISRLRVIDHGWDISSDINTKHNATAVGDGDSVLLTPLGYNLVPPPMSLVTIPLVGAYRYACFWSPWGGNSNHYTSGMAVLCDKSLSSFSGSNVYPSICLTLLDSKGVPLKDSSSRVICLYKALQSLPAFHEGQYTSLLQTSTINNDSHSNHITFRSIAAMEIEKEVLAICVLVNLVHDVDSSSRDHAFVLYYDINRNEIHNDFNRHDSKYIHEIHVQGDKSADLGGEGCMYHIQPWYLHTADSNGDGDINGKCAAFGVVKRRADMGSGCEVLPIPLDSYQNLSLQDNDKQEALLRLPEDCSKVSILTTIHNKDGEVIYLALGLTDKNRLYCGEMLLVAGASSFLVNESLQMVLYITVGAQPKLHFVSFASLSTLDPTQSFDHPDNLLVEFAEARPVERGARLVSAPYGSPKIIVQQPRGNLEGFEPRALVLLQARKLMDNQEYYQVMVMFRRQKIDLNLLIDHNPSLFLLHCDQFVTECIKKSKMDGGRTNQTGIEMLALLITSLSDEDVAVTKYPNPNPSNNHANVTNMDNVGGVRVIVNDNEKDGKGYKEGQKLNTVCTALRASLLKQLNLPCNVDSDGTTHKTSMNTAVVTPLLCTFAKQDPPLLEEALMLIRDIASTTTSSTNDKSHTSNNAGLLSTTTQSHIKYLAFLADRQQIFDAALGCCDFDIAKAIARQCQMDPKVYLPLINEFQAIGEGHDNQSIYAYLMHIAVNRHLDRQMKIIDYCLLAISAYYHSDDIVRANVDKEQQGLEYITDTILGTVREHKCYTYILPRVTQQYTTLCTINNKDMANYREHLIEKVLSPCRQGFATYLMSQYSQSPCIDLYHQAMSYYLSTSPVSIIDACMAARRVSDWPTLISLVTRYESMIASLKKPELAVKRVIADVIDEYEGTIEQGDMYSMEVHTSTTYNKDESILAPSHYHLAEIDKVSYIVSLCVTYLQDVERAVTILLTTRRFSEAITIAMQQSRVDLIEDDIKSALMTESEVFIESMSSKGDKIIEIVNKLKERWQDPVKRLEEVKEKEPWVQRELEWMSQGYEGIFDSTKDYDGMGNDVDDNKSDYSAITSRSDMSFVSQVSNISLLSNSSDNSSVSRQSGSSTVSILSDMGSYSNGNNNDTVGKKGNEFAIAGLEHTLLSKGNGDGDMGNNRTSRAKREGKKKDKYDYDKMVEKNGGQPLTKKQLRRLRRGENAGKDYRGHRDMLGLGKEATLCAELMNIAQSLESMCTICSDLCHAHVLIGQQPIHYSTGIALTKSMDAFCTIMRENPPNIAPAYPTLFLQERDYTSLLSYQENYQHQIPSSALQLNTKLENKRNKYWEVAAKGISFWHSKMKLSLYDLSSTIT